jgi:hypothetical protein
MSPDKKKIEKIYSQIDKLATKGKEYIYEYHKYIDDLIISGDYSYFEQTLYYKYNIDVVDYPNVGDIKNKTWAPILFQTNVPISKKIKKLFDKKGVYQMVFNIHRDSNAQVLGKIVEVDQLSPDAKYYLENKQFAKVIGTRVTYLEVTKQGATSSVLIDNSNSEASEDTNLLNRYKIAIDYLLS